MDGSPSNPTGLGRTRRAPWFVFALCALLVVDVLAWASWRVLALERAERSARAEADSAQRERLALWQMDSLVSALVARESARPYFEYRAAYAADLPYGQAWSLGQAGQVAPSSLAFGTGDPVVRLHYQVEPDGRVVSPQAPAEVVLGTEPIDAADRYRAERWVREISPWVRGLEDTPADARRGRGESEFGDGLLDAATVRAEPIMDADGDGVFAIESEPLQDLEDEPADAALRQQLFDIAR